MKGEQRGRKAEGRMRATEVQSKRETDNAIKSEQRTGERETPRIARHEQRILLLPLGSALRLLFLLLLLLLLLLRPLLLRLLVQALFIFVLLALLRNNIGHCDSVDQLEERLRSNRGVARKASARTTEQVLR